jgi:hypothetical protein
MRKKRKGKKVNMEIVWDEIVFNEDAWGVPESKWLIVHPTANLQRERNTFRAAQLWKVMPVSDALILIGTFYSAGITFDRPVEEK